MTDVPSSPPPPRGIRALSTPQFIATQILTILSTVLGVYLAGYVGFQRTLDYDALVKARNELHVLEALHVELEENTARLGSFIDAMEPSGAKAIYEWPTLRLYLWTSAQNNPALFAAPAETLSGIQGYYDALGTTLGSERVQKLYRSSSGSMAYDRTLIKEGLVAQVALARDQFLPGLEAAMTEPRRVVAAFEAER